MTAEPGGPRHQSPPPVPALAQVKAAFNGQLPWARQGAGPAPGRVISCSSSFVCRNWLRDTRHFLVQGHCLVISCNPHHFIGEETEAQGLRNVPKAR